MAALTVTVLPGTTDYDGSGAVTADSLTTATDTIASNGMVFIRLENTGTPTRTVSIQTVADGLGRLYHGVDSSGTADITLTNGQVKYVGPFSREGWVNSSGQIDISADAAGVDCEAVQFPANHKA